MTEHLSALSPNLSANGFVTIEYKDYLTGRTLEKIDGANQIFKNNLFSFDWFNSLWSNNLRIILSDNVDPIENNIPFIGGNYLGYGVVKEMTDMGAFKGNFIENGSYRKFDIDKKLKYNYIIEFSPTKALGEIKSIGLQYFLNSGEIHLSSFKPISLAPLQYENNNGEQIIDDFIYTITPEKKFVKQDIFTGAITTLNENVSSITKQYFTLCYDILAKQFLIIEKGNNYNFTVIEYTDANLTIVKQRYEIAGNINNSSVDAIKCIKKNNLLFNISSETGNEKSKLFNIIRLDNGEISQKTIQDTIGLNNVEIENRTCGVLLSDRYIAFGDNSLSHSSILYIYDIDKDLFFVSTKGKHDNDNDNSLLTNNFRIIRNAKESLINSYGYNATTEQGMSFAGIVGDCSRYILPIDTPSRPANSTMTINYKLEIDYEINQEVIKNQGLSWSNV